MWIVKKINNNAAICKDSKGNELIAFGKGIGFPNMPYELKDLSSIDRTYYGIKTNYVSLINEIPEEIWSLSEEIIYKAKEILKYELSTNILFTLADHINFSIKRNQENLLMKMPFAYDVQYLFEKELKVGEFALALIEDKIKVKLARDEAVGIAIHFINAQLNTNEINKDISEFEVISEITKIIERQFKIPIDRNSFNYLRFSTHLKYLLKRNKDGIALNSDNNKLFESFKTEFPETFNCVELIQNYMISSVRWKYSKEEILYLMLHVNRLCTREDCNR